MITVDECRIRWKVENAKEIVKPKKVKRFRQALRKICVPCIDREECQKKYPSFFISKEKKLLNKLE